MKHLFYLPAFLALTTVSVYAQDAAVDTETNAGADTELQTQSQPGAESQSSSDLSAGASTESHGSMDFASADKDSNGELSVEEAQEALPDLIIVDINNDGVLNRSEAENAMPGLSLSEGEQGAQAAEDAPVGEQDFLVIVTAIEEQGQDQASVSSSQESDTSLSSTESASPEEDQSLSSTEGEPSSSEEDA